MSLTTKTKSQTDWAVFFLIVGLCWGWFAIKSIAIGLGLVDPPQLNNTKFVRLIIYELTAGIAAYYILRRRGWTLRKLALDTSWSTTGAGMLLLLLSTLLHWITYSIGVSIGGSDEPLRALSNSVSVSWPLGLSASVINGVYEEVLLVWFVFKALERYDLPFIIGVSVLLRIIAHVYQGPIGALSMLTMGVLFALVYARYRQMWTLIVAHAGADIFAIVR